MTYTEIIKESKKIQCSFRRKSFPKFWTITIDKKHIYLFNCKEDKKGLAQWIKTDYIPTNEDLLANDWEFMNYKFKI